MEKSLKITAAALSLSILAACSSAPKGNSGSVSGGCSGGPCTPTYDKSSFETAEYNSQYGLRNINASSVYQYGGVGDGITVAVFDSGIRASHEAFTGRIADGGYDYLSGSSGVVADGTGHGSHVSGIIAGNKNNREMHGVAYQSKILPFRFFDNSGDYAAMTNSTLTDAVSRARNAGVFLFNHSWSTQTSIAVEKQKDIAKEYGTFVQVLQNSVNAGGVHVWSAGNGRFFDVSMEAGMPHRYSDLAKGWVAVVAVDADGAIAETYSNYCGVAAAWCIAAPGSDVNSVSNSSDSAYRSASGTSAAAPHVSGAIAALKTRFPNLSFQQVRERILVTANKRGIYSNSSIYGQGLLDLNAAASPVGSLHIPTTGSANGVSQPLSSSVLPQGIFLNDLPKDILVLDSFQKAPFYISSFSLMQNKKNQIRFDHENIIGESINVNQNGIDIRTGKNISEMNMAQTDSELSFSLGFLNNSYTNNKSLPSSLLNSNKNSVLVGYGVKNSNSTLKAYSWTELNETQDDLFKTNLKQIGFLPSFISGTALSYESSLNKNTNIVAGMGVANAGGEFGGFNGAGAFSSNPKLAMSNWVGLNFSSDIGNIKSNTLIHFAQWNIKQDMSNSLLKSSENLKINDIELSTSFRSNNSKTSATISLGLAKTVDSGSYEIALPTAINENGEISYSNTSISKNSLFNESRGQFKLSHALNPNNSVSTFYGFRKNQQMEHLLGVGMNIKFK